MTHYISIKEANRTKKHYENFPVATLIFPKDERFAATLLYKFARDCDDIADEENFSKKERIKKIRYYEDSIKSLPKKNINRPTFFIDLKKVVENYQIDLNLFHRFLDAFKQDIANPRYDKFSQVIDYCHLAACPAGEMILTLFKQNQGEKIKYSNHLCICLALIGMVQDIKEDYGKKRIYIPKSYFKKFKLDLDDIKQNNFNDNWENLKMEWLKKIEYHLNCGKKLTNVTQGRLQLQIKILVLACEILIKRLKKRTNLFISAPKLSKFDWLLVLFRSLTKL